MSAVAYVVTGASGRCSDPRHWNVKAFLDRQEAEKYREDAEVWAKNWFGAIRQFPYPKCESPFDSSLGDYDYDVGYTVEEIELA
jgi:hypothetical protein